VKDSTWTVGRRGVAGNFFVIKAVGAKRRGGRNEAISSVRSWPPTCATASTRRSSRASRPSRTATCTSATPRRSASNFGIASDFGGRCNLRFDDTNPTKEEQEYIDAIQADVRWLGFDWGEHLYYASDYFEQLYEWAVYLIKAGKAYVDDLTPTRSASIAAR
jgi:hypothetical protein